MRYFFAFALCTSACVRNTVPQEVLDWRPDAFPAADSLAMRTVARQAGMLSPYSFAPPFSYDVGCPKLRIVSDTIVEGNRRSWTELWVYRKGRDSGGHRCDIYREANDTLWQAEPWVASSTGRREESEWRIYDGPWHVDVALGTGVAYDSATFIVQAVRRQALVNQMPTPLRRLFGDTLPAVDASDIREIERNGDETRVYKVRTGIRWGYVLSVSIVAGQVRVHNVGKWIS